MQIGRQNLYDVDWLCKVQKEGPKATVSDIRILCDKHRAVDLRGAWEETPLDISRRGDAIILDYPDGSREILHLGCEFEAAALERDVKRALPEQVIIPFFQTNSAEMQRAMDQAGFGEDNAVNAAPALQRA